MQAQGALFEPKYNRFEPLFKVRASDKNLFANSNIASRNQKLPHTTKKVDLVSSPQVAGQNKKLPSGIGKIKVCVKCNKKFPIEDFPKNSDSSDGYSAYCRDCKNELSKQRRLKDAKARFKHIIMSRLRNEFRKEELPKDLEKNLEHYLGYPLFELRKKVREEVQAEGHTLYQCFEEGWHLDHRRPLSSFPKHQIGDSVFKECWAIGNLKLIPALENLQKGAKYAG